MFLLTAIHPVYIFEVSDLFHVDEDEMKDLEQRVMLLDSSGTTS